MEHIQEIRLTSLSLYGEQQNYEQALQEGETIGGMYCTTPQITLSKCRL